MKNHNASQDKEKRREEKRREEKRREEKRSTTSTGFSGQRVKQSAVLVSHT